MIILFDLLQESMRRKTRFYTANPFGDKFTPTAGAAVRDLGVKRAQHVFGLRRAIDAYIFIENIAPCVHETKPNKQVLSHARRHMIGKHRRRIKR